MMKCDCEGCDKTREFRLNGYSVEGPYYYPGAVDLHFAPCRAITYVRKQVGHE